jgi:hypothetical protein
VGEPERVPAPTSPSRRSATGPSLSPRKGGEGFCRAFPKAILRRSRRIGGYDEAAAEGAHGGLDLVKMRGMTGVKEPLGLLR